MKIIKQISKFILAASCVAIFSCASTKVEDVEQTQVQETAGEKDSTSSEKSDTADGQPPVVEENDSEKKSNYKAFLEKVDGLKMEVTEVPKETTKLKAFLTPYAVKISKNPNGIPLSDLKICVKYPASRNIQTGEITYATETIQIDATSETEGTIDFMPPVPQISINGSVTFSPYFDKTSHDFGKISEEAEKHSATAEYKVRTNLKSAGGVVSILDLDKDGKPQKSGNLKSSSTLLMRIYGAGFRNVGNDDFAKEIAEGDETKLYNSALARYKNASFTFLICGVYKYDTDAVSENPSDVNLIGEVTCFNIKAQSEEERVLFKSSQKATGKNLNAAIEELSKKLADDVIYGM